MQGPAGSGKTELLIQPTRELPSKVLGRRLVPAMLQQWLRQFLLDVDRFTVSNLSLALGLPDAAGRDGRGRARRYPRARRYR